jgi:hypothetical protein
VKKLIIKFLSPKIMKWRGEQRLFEKIGFDVSLHGLSTD